MSTIAAGMLSRMMVKRRVREVSMSDCIDDRRGRREKGGGRRDEGTGNEGPGIEGPGNEGPGSATSEEATIQLQTVTARTTSAVYGLYNRVKLPTRL